MKTTWKVKFNQDFGVVKDVLKIAKNKTYVLYQIRSETKLLHMDSRTGKLSRRYSYIGSFLRSRAEGNKFIRLDEVFHNIDEAVTYMVSEALSGKPLSIWNREIESIRSGCWILNKEGFEEEKEKLYWK